MNPDTLAILPTVNAVLNATAAILLVVGYMFVKRGRIAQHRACMISAFVVSTLFLVSYLTYHAHVGSKRFPGTGTIRTVYLSILLTHTVLAALVPFLAIITLWRALTSRFDRHVRIARWTLPIWIYVSITGVIVYLMLYQLGTPTRP